MQPIVTHIWCVRPKLLGGRKRYGAFPAGSLEKFRLLMGVHINDPVLHVCGGWARYYTYNRGFGPNDKTLDLDPSVEPDFLQDAREPWPMGFKAAIADPDYSFEDAAQRPMGAATLPTPATLITRAYAALDPGRRFGILHVKTPRVNPKRWFFVAKMNVSMGYEARERVFSVFERV